MNRRYRLALLRLLLLIGLPLPLSAHLFDPTTLTIPLGQTRTWSIYADVSESGGTNYSVTTAPNGSFATITSKHNFTQKIKGSWTIKGTGIGTTLAVFHWSYPPHDAEATLSVTIQVVPPPDDSASNPNHLSAGDPINTRGGEFYAEEAVDFSLGGPLPLSFARYYSSALQTGGLASSALGTNRLHTFDWKLVVEIPNQRVRITTERGRPIYFEKQALAPAWVLSGRQDLPYQLVESGGLFRLADPLTQLVRTFDNTGKLTKVEDGRGNSHTLTYVGTTTTITDGLGRSLELTHTAGKLTKVADHTGRDVNFTYSGNNLATASDTLDKITTYTYTSNLLTSFTRPEANVPFTQVFTGGKVTSQTERGTDTTSLVFNPNSTVITNPVNDTMTHNYAATGDLTSVADEAGKVITVTNDAAGRRNSVTDRLGDRTLFTYHEPSGKPAVITNAEGRSTTMSYKSRTLNGHTFHDLAKITYPDGTSRAFTYDANGNVKQVTDQAGKNWKFTRNGRGQVLTMTNPLGGVTTYTYNDLTGNLVSTQDPDNAAGVTTTYGYDALNRVTQITLPGVVSVITGYDARDRVISIIDERGKQYTYDYDDNGRLTTVTDPDAKTQSFAYDTLDRVTQITDRLGKISSLTYNSRQLAETFTDRNGNTTSLQYDARRRPISFTDAGAKVWQTGYDDEGLAISGANPVDAPDKIKRNKLGQPVEISDPLGNTDRLVRDAMQRVIQAFDPLGRATTFVYDKRGDLISSTEQSVGTGKFDRDGLGNITKVTDPGGGIWAHTYTKGGRLLSSKDPLGKVWSHTYDTRGRLQTTAYPDGTTATLTYDAGSNVTNRSYTGTQTLNQGFSYDNLGRVSTADVVFSYDAEGRVTNAQQGGFNFNASYDDGGRLLTVSYRNAAIVVTYQYDSRNRLIKVTDSVSSAQVDFTYDDAGRLTGMERSNNVDGIYSYDAAGRLKRIQEGNVMDLEFSLDAAGEIVSVDYEAPLLPAVGPEVQTFKFGKAGQLTTTGYVYDNRGRLTAAPGGVTFTWDAASRLTNVGGVTLSYNSFNDLVQRTEGAVITDYFSHYAIQGAPIVYESVQGGDARAYVWTPDGELLYSIAVTGAQPTFYHFDHHGSTLMLTNAAGVATDHYAYGPFGEPLGQTGPGASTQPFTYIGAYGVRAEGTLYQMGLRYYDPETARFLSRDPLPPDLTTPESLNPYQYAYNNPLAYIDPEGTHPERRRPRRCGPPTPEEVRERKDRKARERAERLRDAQLASLARLNAGLHRDALSKPSSSGCKVASDMICSTAASPCTGGGATLFDLGIYAGGAYTTDWFTIGDQGFTGNLPGAPPGQSGGPVDGPPGGGGIFNPGPLTLGNSTISGNQPPPSDGGGILLPPPASLPNSTFSGNQADSGVTIIGGDPNAPIHPKTNLPKGLNPGLRDFVILPGNN